MEKGEKVASSRSGIFVVCLIIAIVSFAAGTRSDQIWGTVGSMLGLRTSTSSVNLTTVQETYRALQANFDGDLDNEQLIYGASKGLVAAAKDPHTAFLDPSDVEELEREMSGSIGGGIGIEVGMRSDKLTVIRPIKDSPAAKAGAQAGDVILAVNDQLADTWTVDQAVQKIRGEIGTKVKLTVLRDKKDFELSMTRQEIVSPTVEAEIDGQTGILTVHRFNGETGTLARAEATKFVEQGVDKVVLDLRGNPGGEVSAAQALAGLWLDNEVLMTHRRGGEIVKTDRTTGKPLLGEVRTVVLINASSASASEIVAGALKEHNKAVLVGEKTFGKGSVQALIRLSGGAQLKVTESRWFTPKGKNIDKEGIQPDIEVELTAEDFNNNRDPQLERAKEL